MQLEGNTILITGGTSGIGRGLAEAFHLAGNQVIVTGRREERLSEICEANSGMRSIVLDVTDPASIRSVAVRAIATFPALNCVINNAGIQNGHDFSAGQVLDQASAVEEVDTNLLGVIRVAAEFVPHLTGRPNATLVNVSSGLAFVPLARFPVYCATKAAVHSFTLSLRHQLKDRGIRVIELIPPYVATELGGPRKSAGAAGPTPMPLDEFIAATMRELATEADEIAIGGAKDLAAASGTEAFKMAFERMND
jgi:uncharacterized oxidoreductase